MGKYIDDFHKRLNSAVLPSLRWTARDSATLWKIPLTELPDYFTLKTLKKKGSHLPGSQETFVQDLRCFVEPYIESIQKGYKYCYDYLFYMGDIVLTEMVQMHLENKFGKDSPELKAFSVKEEELWREVVKIRAGRKTTF